MPKREIIYRVSVIIGNNQAAARATFAHLTKLAEQAKAMAEQASHRLEQLPASQLNQLNEVSK